MSEIEERFPKTYGRMLVTPSVWSDGKFAVKQYVRHGGPHWMGDRFDTIAEAVDYAIRSCPKPSKPKINQKEERDE